MENASEQSFRPPYFSFKTFLGFLESLVGEPLPPEIDRSMMGSKSGADQSNILAALKGFGFISDAQIVEPLLSKYVNADGDARKAIVRDVIRDRYASQLAVSERNGTAKQLNESFEETFNVTGDTLRKAVTFFLQGARYAGINLSQYFPTTRMGSGRRPSTEKRRKAKQRNRRSARREENPPPGAGESRVISLGDAGSVTVSVAVRWLELPDDKLSTLRQAIRDLEGLAEPVEEEDDPDLVVDDEEVDS